MPHFIPIFLTIVISLAIIIAGIGWIAEYGYDTDFDAQYYDEDGDHIYYERSIIEKKLFHRRFPDITNLRSFRRLFGSPPTP